MYQKKKQCEETFLRKQNDKVAKNLAAIKLVKTKISKHKINDD